jgi:hypothetical protein
MVQKASPAERPPSMPCYIYYASVLYLGSACWEFSAATELALPHVMYASCRLAPEAYPNHGPYV